MNGQIGLLAEIFSADARPQTGDAAQLPGKLTSGDAFQLSFDTLNAEWTAESPLAQQVASFQPDDAAAILPLGNISVEEVKTEVPAGAEFDLAVLSLEPKAIEESALPVAKGPTSTADAELTDIPPANLPNGAIATPDTNADTPIGLSSDADSDLLPAPSQQGPANRLSQTPVSAFTPFQQTAATVLSESPNAAMEPELAESAAANPAMGERIIAEKTAKDSNAIPTVDAKSADTNSPLAPSQQGTPKLASSVPAAEDSPLPQQESAAALPGEASTADAPKDVRPQADADALPQRASDNAAAKSSPNDAATKLAAQPVTSDTLAADGKHIATSDTPLAPSQLGASNTLSRVNAPVAVPPLMQQNAAAAQTAQVADIPNVMTEALALDDGSKRVTVQLDPPELGRVSIDFKFDGNALQSVVVTGETPEAMRRLRLMHFELMQTLESHGYSGQDLDFSQRDEGRQASLQANDFACSTESDADAGDADEPAAAYSQAANTQRPTSASEGLNLKL